MSTHHKAKTLTNNTIWKSFITFVMLCGTRDRTCGSGNVAAASWQRTSLFLTTDSNFLGQTTFLWLDRIPTLPTWLLAITGCSSTWKRSWKGLDLSHETTLYGTRRASCTPFAKRHSRNASNNGRTAGRSVFSHKETTSKGIRVADLQACKCIFPGQRSDTFCTAHVMVPSNGMRSYKRWGSGACRKGMDWGVEV